MELTSKKGFALSRFTVFGVAQFFLYMSMFAVFYLHNQAAASNAEWMEWGVLAMAAAMLVNVLPYLIHKGIMLPSLSLSLLPFLNVIVPVALYLLFVAGYCFYTWSVPPADDFLITFAKFYLFGTAGFTAFAVVLDYL